MKSVESPSTLPRLVLVGGPDVDARLDVIQLLAHEFDVIVLGSNRRLTESFEQLGISYHYYNLSRGVAPVADIRTIFQLTHLLSEIRPDIVHVFDTKPSVLARIAAYATRVPVVIATLPGLGSLYIDQGIRRRLVRIMYEQLQRLASRLSTLTVFQNSDDLWEFVDRNIVPSSKARIIRGSGVRTDLFDPDRFRSTRDKIREDLGIPEHTVVVTMISRVIRSKGILHFSGAAELLSGSNGKVRFLLAGSDDAESLDRLKKGEIEYLRRVVTWLGNLADVAPILAASDIFVLPTHYREGIPRVLLEAASMGLPLVATNVPGCREVVQSGVNGLLVPTQNTSALASAISQLVADRSRRERYGRASRQIALDHFSTKVVAEQMRTHYNLMLKTKHHV